ncbi:MAG: endolytic transglycosylase MltG [Myxococcales bacterium]|nr:endolytic transglycosylase MltG [Myxococcota bacterium]MDW8281384.1 endolytic transglycosylase MltG [Myxococcales bacterium]
MSSWLASPFRRAALVVGLTFGAFFLVVGWLVWQAVRYPDRPGPPEGPTEAKVIVGKGMTLSEIARLLADKKIITHPEWFRFYANERGAAARVRAGAYTLSARMTPRQVLDTLLSGAREVEVPVTIPEGKHMLEVAALLEEAGICKASEAERLMRDPAYARSLGVPGGSLEGYLFPDTYKFPPGSSCTRVLPVLVRRFQRVLGELKSQHFEALRVLNRVYGFGDREIVILASIVEKETGQPEERPRIAGVFLNRLRLPSFKPHRLETDPTIIYGCTVPLEKSEACKKFEGRIRRIHLEDRDNPYNTYTHEGLPPGPIANPGRAALRAVFAPEQTPYLYFVSRNDGTHQFSATLQEHRAAVDRYQRRKPPVQ